MNEHNSPSVEQKRGILRTVAAALVVMALFFGLFLHNVLSPRIMSPDELSANGAIVFDLPRIVEAFELVDHSGQPFNRERLLGKWTLMFFGFSHCPDICPTTLAKLDQVVAKLDPSVAARVQVAMLSVDPARDTPDILAQYVPYFNPAFIGVTGDFLQVMKLSRNLNVAFNKVSLGGGDYTVDHTGNLILINPMGDYHGFFKPPFELARLKTTLSSIVIQGP